jgi:hypothetical protein
VHSLAAREARVASDPAPGGIRRFGWELRRGSLFCCVALAACAPVDTHALAREDDRRAGTRIFSWLVDHEPSAVVVWHGSTESVRALLPTSRIEPAIATKVCRQAARDHALLLLVEPRSATDDRNVAEDCGFALDRDAGAIIVAPR